MFRRHLPSLLDNIPQTAERDLIVNFIKNSNEAFLGSTPVRTLTKELTK